ncbi:hypothetical protein IW261DRAFT_1445456 [Armillaria novae-zelandiae]|uniref:Uncharacterized protein n=1 Tax=Armillaria novae-zelandiae TaxID=153914 RepID=A0AA39UKT4_9AGAR|nr:hypothetical protein IW261DRAFT_1445456 [Armillaria novae-zelandiae]
MKDFLSGGEESNGNEDYVGSATECGAQPHELRSGREYGPNKSRLNKETASKESPRPGITRGIRGSTPRRTSSSDTQVQGISRRRPPKSGPTHAYVPNSDQAASSSKRRRTAYRVISSSEDESRSPSPELERPVRRCESFRDVHPRSELICAPPIVRRLRRWSERTHRIIIF